VKHRSERSERRFSVSAREGTTPFGEAADAPARTYSLIVKMLLGIRLVQLLPWPIGLIVDAHFSMANPRLAILSYVLQATWSLTFAVRVWRTKTLPDPVVLTDVLVSSVCLVLAGRGCAADDSASWGNPAVYPAIGVALCTAASWWPRRAIAASTLLAFCYLVGVQPDLRSGGPIVASVGGNVLSLIGFSIVAGMVSNQLMVNARAAASTWEVVLEARERTAAQRARYEERKVQYRILHDTVLSTLNAIARGAGCDLRLRQRCAAEADLIRNMISRDNDPPGSLTIELALVAHHQAALGLRVHCQTANLPGFLPPEVIAALTGACREALNNVAKHAGTDEAWVTAFAEPGGSVTITIVDRGNGFDLGSLIPGQGLRYSISARMAEVGGDSRVDSEIGDGATIELRWPK
jgi:anti-sigma regulatory factor (Ser/Thr protein kinase)